MKRGTPDHPKMLMLASALKVKKYVAVGLMETLWHFTARYAPAGDIGKYEDEIIAGALDWDGTLGDLIDALVKVGWLDLSNTHRLIVHDWSEHSDDAADKYLLRNGLKYADGNNPRRSENKSEQVRTSPDKSGKVRTCPEKSGHVRKSQASHTHTHTHTQTHTQEGGTCAGEVGTMDAAHGILKSRPELNGLSWEQDLVARKDFGALAGVDWLAVAKRVAERAVLAGPGIEQPGSWLRKQYDRIIREMYSEKFEKKTAPGGDDPRRRMFQANEG